MISFIYFYNKLFGDVVIMTHIRQQHIFKVSVINIGAKTFPSLHAFIRIPQNRS